MQAQLRHIQDAGKVQAAVAVQQSLHALGSIIAAIVTAAFDKGSCNVHCSCNVQCCCDDASCLCSDTAALHVWSLCEALLPKKSLQHAALQEMRCWELLYLRRQLVCIFNHNILADGSIGSIASGSAVSRCPCGFIALLLLPSLLPVFAGDQLLLQCTVWLAAEVYGNIMSWNEEIVPALKHQWIKKGRA